MKLFVDTSVWSLVLRRDAPELAPEANFLARALESGALVFTTGLVLQELLQGFSGPKHRDIILAHFAALPFLVPDRDDHVAAAELRNDCRRHGRQVTTIDALLARICIRHDLTMITTDVDFAMIAELHPLNLWG